MKCLLFILLSAFCLLTEGKIFTKCGLVEELNLRNFPRSFIGQWVCMIESESFKDTSKVYVKANGSKNLGLFQINDRGWCEYGKAGGKCAMKCEDLLNEYLADDAACAKKFQGELGFQYWDGWVRNCKQQNIVLPC